MFSPLFIARSKLMNLNSSRIYTSAASLVLSTSASISLATVTFKEGPLKQSIEVGANTLLDMNTLLVSPAPKNAYWRVLNLPNWLKIDGAIDQYKGSPTCKDLGTTNLEIAVVEPGVNAAKAQFELNVFSNTNCAPQWYDSADLAEYQLPADEPLALELKKSDLLKLVFDPEGQAMQVSFGSLPTWLTMTPGPTADSVFLTGKATKEQLLQDFKLEVIVSDGQASSTGFITLTLYIP
jgi:hypothetical protein